MGYLFDSLVKKNIRHPTSIARFYAKITARQWDSNTLRESPGDSEFHFWEYDIQILFSFVIMRWFLQAEVSCCG